MAKLVAFEVLSGVMSIDKPAGVSSADVDYAVKKHVARLMRQSLRRAPKVGHAGTLDPFATGLQLIGIGNATKDLHLLSGETKRYLATITLGKATDTDDLTGEVIYENAALKLNVEEFEIALNAFRGKFDQNPCTFSAKYVDGKRAYDLARKGEKFRVKEQTVEVFDLKLLNSTKNDDETVSLEIDITVSAGTFIRAIARDLGENLGCGGHLTSLRRIAIGESFCMDTAKTLNEVLATENIAEFQALLSRYVNGTVIALGTFDGIHLGHQALLQTVIEIAKQMKAKPVVLIIDRPVNGKNSELTTIQQRITYIQTLGIQEVQVIKLTDELMQMSYEDFTDKIIAEFNAKAFVMTESSRFGKDGLGNVQTLTKYLATDYPQTRLHTVKLIKYSVGDSAKVVSSSLIKALIQENGISANKMLTRAYKLTGTVIHGYERGREIGFPTANIGKIATLIPANGVYYGSVVFAENIGAKTKKVRHPAMISVGNNPTFGNQQQSVEVHIPGRTDFELYDKEVTVAFESKLRNMQAFSSVEALKEQLTYDAKLSEALWALDSNGLVIMPTDTVFGIFGLYNDEVSKKIYEIKHRPKDKHLQVMVPNLESAQKLGVFNQKALELAEEGWPGALTLVVPSREPHEKVSESGGETIGIRIPDDEALLKVLNLRAPLYASSANLAGKETVNSIQEAKTLFDDKIAFYADFAPKVQRDLNNAASQVIDITGDEPKTLR